MCRFILEFHGWMQRQAGKQQISWWKSWSADGNLDQTTAYQRIRLSTHAFTMSQTWGFCVNGQTFPDLQYLYYNRILILKNWMYCFAWILNDSISRHFLHLRRAKLAMEIPIFHGDSNWNLPWRCGEVHKMGLFTRNPLVFHQFHR